MTTVSRIGNEIREINHSVDLSLFVYISFPCFLTLPLMTKIPGADLQDLFLH